MPLLPGSDRKTISTNIHEMMASGHPHDQAVAASLHNADQSKPHRAAGGMLNLGDTIGGMFGGGGGFSNAMNKNPVAGIGNLFGGGFSRAASGGGSDMFGAPGMAQSGLMMPGMQPGGSMGGGFHTPFDPRSQPLPQPAAPINHVAPLPPAPSGMTPSGPTNQVIARAPGGSVPWYARNEARSMLHTGPIRSPVAGRTDHIPLKVPGGSYILPADHVSHMGQNNTEAGMARAAHMFGGAGPFGSSLPKVARGRGAPHAPPVPRPQPNPSLKSSVFADGGKTHEGRVDDGDEGVDIMAAGGEFAVPPEVVREIGGGNIDHGHQVLDEWVLRTRNEHKKTLAKLPRPAK